MNLKQFKQKYADRCYRAIVGDIEKYQSIIISDLHLLCELGGVGDVPSDYWTQDKTFDRIENEAIRIKAKELWAEYCQLREEWSDVYNFLLVEKTRKSKPSQNKA